MDKLLFGDNQFFGVNHMSEEKARQQQIRFQRIEAVIDVLIDAYEEQVTTFMCTTHDRIGEVAAYFLEHQDRYPDMTFFPGMPYAHKYANAVTTDGMLGALKKFLPSSGRVDAAVRGASSLMSKDIEAMVIMLIDAEMKMFEGLPTPVIWLQNVVTDLLLGLGFDDAFTIFAEHVRSRYNAEPGFITMNLPMLAPVLSRLAIPSPLICSNINKIGFRMPGGIEKYRKALESHDFRPVAMSVYASGAIAPDEAIQWVCEQPNIESIVFGASSRRNIRGTRELVDKYWRTR
ncbi:MAG: hypothetical protein Q4P15_05680 [Propionibacteriaceae bacterium]|nr:hypothetical protein [Propionibacteriaceae bacterium]